jgi:S1-C subfamily serine protease
LGHPLDLGPTLKTGRIVGLSRTVHSLENLIQLEASVYPGDSGGPMMDSDGRLVGMLTLALHSHGRHSNIGFAVSIETLIKVVPSLIRSGQDRK